MFVHGLLVNANLWRKVVAELSPDFHCVALDLPLGSHLASDEPRRRPQPDGLADLIADAIEALGLDDVTLVGNDTRRRALPDRGHPAPGAGRPAGAHLVRLPRRLPADRCSPTSSRRPRSRGRCRCCWRRCACGRRGWLPFAFGWLVKRPIDRAAEDSYVLAGMAVPGVMDDVRKVVKRLPQALHERGRRPAGRVHQAGADRVVARGPVLQARPRRALARDLGNARLEWIDDARTFSSEDQPGRLAELIAGFVREPVPVST